MKRSRGYGMGLGLRALVWCHVAALTPQAVLGQGIAVAQGMHGTLPDLAGASWMAAEPEKGQLLVAVGGTPPRATMPRLLVLSLDGRLRSTHTLTGVAGLEAAEIHYFPSAQTAAIVVYPDSAEPDSALGQAAELAPAKVRLLDLESGRMQAMPGLATAVGVDLKRNRLFLARGQNLRIIDAATGQLLQTRRFARNIEALHVSSNGRVHFLQSGFAGGPNGSSRILSLAPPAYAIASRKAVSNEEDGMALMAVDEKHGYALLAEEIGDGLDDELDFGVTAEPLSAEGPSRRISGPDSFVGELIGWREGAPYLYLHDAAAGELRIYDAATLHLMQTRQDVRGELIGYAPGGEVLMSSGRQLERRDPRTFEVLHSVSLDGPIQKAVIDGEAQRVHLLIEKSVDGRWTDQLLRLGLEELQPLL